MRRDGLVYRDLGEIAISKNKGKIEEIKNGLR